MKKQERASIMRLAQTTGSTYLWMDIERRPSFNGAKLLSGLTTVFVIQRISIKSVSFCVTQDGMTGWIVNQTLQVLN